LDPAIAVEMELRDDAVMALPLRFDLADLADDRATGVADAAADEVFEADLSFRIHDQAPGM
jgi:hypothetical protein